MKKTMEIIRYEITSALGRKSYILIAFGLPILAVLIFTGISLVRSSNSNNGAAEQEQESFQFEIEGYVDKAGIVSTLPEDIPEEILVPFSDEEAAKFAMENQEITAYYVIPEDRAIRNLSFRPPILTKYRVLNGLAGKVLSSERVLIHTLIYSREVSAKHRSTIKDSERHRN